ncbi:MAG: tRNA (adenosine(37)-N6)-dimethylallyltransferase MiaA [Chloroflexota bacterium]|nr:tRNA (adenosine(37)-N6)-dimethylallyltransferase MiaA [Chloroflexota bacterium]
MQHQPPLSRPFPIVVLAGPTGVGKSALGLDLAERFGFEIVSADSRQVYRQLAIGTAKPTPAERARVPHHLVDYVDLDEPYSVARFRADGDRVLADLARRGVGALVVGGTQHYVEALIDRIEPPAVPPDPELRSALEREVAERGTDALHAQLAAVDPASAAAIPATNVRRVVRALEVTRATGRPFSEVSRRRGTPLPALRLALTMPRDELYRRVDERVDAMLAAGWLDEIRAVLAAGYSPNLPALSSTGYRELIAALRGEIPLEEAIQRTKWSTHAYIRRQYVWLRHHGGYEWIEQGSGAFEATARIERFLGGLA